MSTRKKRAASRRQRARRQTWLWIGLVRLAAVLIVAALIAATRQNEPGEKIASLGNAHIPEPASAYIYNSRPPTSGPHAPNIAPWGIHDETVNEWLQVHNLEDGGVIIHYNCPEGCPEIVSELEDIVNDMGTEQLILHPYTNMDSRIAVTAWTRLLTLDEVDRDQIVEFIEAYRGIDNHPRS
jgi:hypothetical protein